MTIDSGKFYASRVLLFLACILVILTGLALRRYGYAIGLTFPVVKYGGSVLWGAMAYLLIATLLARHRTLCFVVVTACCIAIAVELLRLVHFPRWTPSVTRLPAPWCWAVSSHFGISFAI